MAAVLIPVIVGADRRLVIDLPETTPLGPADLVLLPRPNNAGTAALQAREEARATLLAAGFLATHVHAPVGTSLVTDDDLARLGQLPSGAQPSEVLVDEDRGSH